MYTATGRCWCGSLHTVTEIDQLRMTELECEVWYIKCHLGLVRPCVNIMVCARAGEVGHSITDKHEAPPQVITD